jgi:hypothetical protein
MVRAFKHEVQSVIFKRKYWTKAEARDWLKKHRFISNYKPVDVTTNYLRYRQQSPLNFSKFRLKNLSNNIKLVLGFNE